MMWLLMGVLLMIWTAVFRWKNRKLIALAKTLSRKDICLPILGHSYKFLGSDEDRMIEIDKAGRESYKTGGILGHWNGPMEYWIMISDPVLADVLLKTCLEKADIMSFLRVMMGNGSVFAQVPIWRPRRKVLAPTFSQKNLNSFVEVFSHQSKVMVDQLSKVSGKGTFSVWRNITTYNMDSVCETTLGIKLNTQLEPELPFLQNFENCCRIDAKRIYEPWFYNDTVNKIFNKKTVESHTRSIKYIWDFMNKIIQSKWESLEKINQQSSKSKQTNKKNWKTFLELLIESPVGYGSVELREETLVLVVGGTDTSAVGTAFTIIMLAMYPDVQQKAYEEIQQIFGNSDRAVSHEDLPQLKYLDAVIKESLRLYPPAPVIVRKVDKDVKLPTGITLPNGCNLFVSIWSIHRNPKYWGDDADVFRPERFLEAQPTHPAAFIPFSYGPRGCLGYRYALMSMKTVLSILLRRYRILPTESMKAMQNDSNDPSKPKLRVKFDIMMKHVDNFEIQLEPRT